MKPFLLIPLFMITILLLSTLSACTNKEDRCEQVVFAAKKMNMINNNMYHSKKLHKACVKRWEDKGAPEWRDCVLDAETSSEMLKCTPPPFIFVVLKVK